MNATQGMPAIENGQIPPAEKTLTAKKRGSSSKLKRNFPYYIMLLPGLLVLLINNYIPMTGIVIAFENFHFNNDILTSYITSPKVGLNNFAFLFQTVDLANAVRNTICYNLVFIVLDLVVPVALAIGLNEIWNKNGAKFFQSAAFLPYFMSWMVVAYLGLSLFESTGVANNLLALFGIPKTMFYLNPQYWPAILTAFHMWKYTGYNVVVYLAALSGISDEYYEAAVLDGASKWQQIRYITLPMLKTVMIILTLFAVGRIFNSDFGLFYNVPRNQGPLYVTTQTIDTYVYNVYTTLGNPGMVTAAGLLQAVCGCVTVLFANFAVRTIDKEQALF